MNRIAYIPARGGSKGIPRKNIREINGQPLIAYAINAARTSNLFAKIMVSTDDEEIAKIAEACGAWIPFLRDPAVSSDKSSSIESICSDKARLEAMGFSFDSLCMLQPTSPLRSSEDIIGAYELFERKKAGVIGLSPVEENPYLMRTVREDGSVGHLLPIRGALRRQDMPQYYKINGAIYINYWSELTIDLTQADNPYGYVMAREAGIDIDTEDDLRIVEKLLANRNNRMSYET